MEDQTKINTANKILKDYLTKRYDKNSYVYIDFVKENRFLTEIQSDKNVIISEMNAQDLADYAIEQIDNSSSRSNLLGF